LKVSGALLIITLAGSAIVGLGIWAFVRSLPDTNPTDYYSNRAKISVSRLVSCGIGCPDLNYTGIISNYPNLKEALNQTDAKYFQKVNDSNCHRNDCMRDLFFNDTVDFTMPKDRALRMSDDFLAFGADKHGQCFEGGCHTITFRVDRMAVYEVRIDYRLEAFEST
jgi:hypothetical protein